MKKLIPKLILLTFILAAWGSGNIISQEMAFVTQEKLQKTDREKAKLLGQKKSLEKVLNMIEKEYGVYFTYSYELVKGKSVVFQSMAGRPLNNVLESILLPIGFRHQHVRDRFYVIKTQTSTKKGTFERDETLEANVSDRLTGRSIMTPMQPLSVRPGTISRYQFPVTGTVRSESGDPLIGVNVLLKGTGRGTTTDIDGAFSLDLDSGEDVLVFSYIGYQTLEVPVNNRSVIDVVLIVEARQLDEVVITALGIQKEAKKLGYATSNVDAEEINVNRTPNFMNALQGKVAGVNISTPFGWRIFWKSDLNGSQGPYCSTIIPA